MFQLRHKPEETPGVPVRRIALLPFIAAVALSLASASEARADVVDIASGATVESAAEAVLNAIADADAEVAVSALSKHVTESSDPGALRTAFVGYFRYKAAKPESVRKPYLYYVDLGLDSHASRGYVFDMSALKLVEGPFAVAHGRGSSDARDGVPSRFSNTSGSYATSLGLYLAGATYAFKGTSAGKNYSSTGLRLLGESGSFNDAAESRGIVAHGAPYVTAGGAGRSEGCPAMEPSRAKRLLPLLAKGGVVFLYSPNDERWLREDPWLTEAR